MCCEITKMLKVIADNILKKEHHEIAEQMTEDDEVEFYNSVRALQEHAEYIARKRAA